MHTTCGLTVNEGADPNVAIDLVQILRQLVPQSPDYRHDEGNSDSHAKTSLFGPGLTLLIEAGQPVLGTWQHVFLAEWDGPRTRQIAYKIVSAG
jgi:secondary thiamine-phosphate synthase enzyme